MAKKRETKAEKEAEKEANQRKKPAQNAKKVPQPAKKTPKTEKKQPRSEKKSVKKEKPAPEKKNPKITRPTKAEQIEIGKRRLRVLDLKANYGASVRQIASRLQAEGFKASPATIQSDLDAILDEIALEQSLSAERWQTLLIERLEAQFFRVSGSMIEFDPETGKQKIVTDTEKENLLLRNFAQLDRMVGASKAEQSKNNAAELLAKLIGADPKELPAGDDESDA